MTCGARQNLAQLKPHFDKVVLIDIRTTLRGSKLSFKIHDLSYSFQEFKYLVGDNNAVMAFPSYWLISPAGRQVKQLPHGNVDYTMLETHIEILKTP